MKQERISNEDIKKLLSELGLKVNDISIYERAFTHRSFLNEFKEDQTLLHNERLEFLGDAVLELIVSEFLFKTYPDRPEGELTSFRAATVKTDTLAQTSRELGYGPVLRMSKGEEATGGRDKDYLLANTFEAVLGAVYLDQGYEASEEFVTRVLVHKLDGIVENRLDIDSKTKFQEVAQAKFKLTPTYEVISEVGPDHEKTFTMGVYIGDKEYGRGEGKSKQRAEEEAAEKALKKVDN
jgi:ribonuclease-3